MIKHIYVANLSSIPQKKKLNTILSYFFTFKLHYDDDALLSFSILRK